MHASAVQAGDIGILIRGPSGAGKSRLAFDLILAGRAGHIPPTHLVGDDRLLLAAEDGQISVRPAAELEGLIEIRGLGIRRCDFVPQAAIGLVVDLAAPTRPACRNQTPCGSRFTVSKYLEFRLEPTSMPCALVTAALLTRPLGRGSACGF